MTNFFGCSISEKLHSRWCRFIIHRYLGHLLDKNLQLEQLSVDLLKGHVEVDQVMLNAQYVNELLSSMNVPLKLVDGFIGNIRIQIPWKEMMADASQVDLQDVQLTFRTQEGFKLDDKELVSSMIGSVVESLVSSMDLAQSFYKEEERDGGVSLEENPDSVHAFAKVIDAIVSRFCCKIEQLILRIESDASPAPSDMCTALELHLNTVEFMDEQMRACRQEGKNLETITAQPHGNASVKNLNKYLTLTGVSLFTDTFSKTEQAGVFNDSLSPVTSMYLRREHKKSLQKAGSPHASMYMSALPVTESMTSIYKSCYSITQESPFSLSAQPTPSLLSPNDPLFKPMRRDNMIFSNPVKFAELAGQTRIILRICNTDVATAMREPQDSRVEFDLYIDALNALVTPSQLHTIQSLAGSLFAADAGSRRRQDTGQPMAGGDFDVVQQQLDDITYDAELPAAGNAIGRTGNWRGVEDFRGFASISLNGDTKQSKLAHDLASRNSISDSPKSGPSGKRETAMIRANIGTGLIYVTHDDPLNTENVSRLERGAFDAIEQMHANSKRFFEKASSLKFYATTQLDSLQRAASELYQRDHLRLLASGISAQYTVETNARGNQRLFTKLTMTNCDVSECLQPESVKGGTKLLRIPLLEFERDDGEADAQLTITVRVEERKSTTTVHLSRCRSELDMSMIDRIAELLATRPFYLASGSRVAATGSGASLAPSHTTLPPLNEDLFSDVTPAKEASVSTVEINCADWIVDIRIPIVDLRGEGDCDRSERLPHSVRNVHDEVVRLHLAGGQLCMPAQAANGPKIIELTCTRVVGSFTGDLEKLQCAADETNFLYMGGSQLKPVRFKFEYDGRNKSLRTSATKLLPSGMDDMAKSFSAEYTRRVPRRDGPFSQTHQAFTQSNTKESGNETIVKAGSRAEMESFAFECMEHSDRMLQLDSPVMRLLLPNHHFLELLYNRLVNDLALWEPSAPAFRSKTDANGLNDCFKECKSVQPVRSLESEDDDGDDERASRTSDRKRLSRSQSHFFSFCLDIGKGSLVLGTETPSDAQRPAVLCQLSGNLSSTQLFVVYGFHGDLNQTYFYLTTSSMAVAQRNGIRSVPHNVLAKDFGAHHKSEVQLSTLAADSFVREGREEDAFAVAFHLKAREGQNVKDSVVAVALRLTELNVVPMRSICEWWLIQLKDLFTLEDYAIPGYEMPVVSTELHVNLDHVVISYDHSVVKPDSRLHLKMVLGNVDISSTLLPTVAITKFLFIFERVHLHMYERPESVGGGEGNGVPERKAVRYADEPVAAAPSSPTMVHVMELGLFHLELLINAQKEDSPERMAPYFDLRCSNDLIKVWVCHDSLAALINTVYELSNAPVWSEATDGEGEERKEGDGEEDGMSESAASSHTRVSSRKLAGSQQALSASAEKRLLRMVENACLEAPEPAGAPNSSSFATAPSAIRYAEDRSMGVAVGQDALDTWSDEDVQIDQKQPYAGCASALLDDALREPRRHRNSSNSLSTDEEFLMVDEIVGSGITPVTGEPRIRLLGKCDKKNPDAPPLPLHAHWFKHSVEPRADLLEQPAGLPVPLARYLLKDISFALHLYGGNDLGTERENPKSYSADEYREGVGKGQSVLSEARGGPFRDHSVSIVVDLSKMTYMYQFFPPECKTQAMHYMAVQDVTIHDRLTLSNIKEMLYQFTSVDQPRRTCAPMLAVRMVETPAQEGKLRVSLLPVRVNLDQDTLDFLEDFVEAVTKSLSLPMSSALHLQSRPVIEVPEGCDGLSSEPSPTQRPSVVAPMPSAVPLQPLPSPRPPVPVFETRLSALSDLDDLEEPQSLQPSLSDIGDFDDLAEPPKPPPRRKTSNRSRNPFEDDLDDPSETMSCSAGGLSHSREENTNSFMGRSTLFDMRHSIHDEATEETSSRTGDFPGDWASSSEIRFTSSDHFSLDHPVETVDDLLGRSTMESSIYMQQEASGGGDVEGEEDNDTICSEAGGLQKSTTAHDEPIRGQTFFKEFNFEPEMTIYIDYHGKNRYNIDKAGAVFGVLRGIGQLNRTKITLKAIRHHNGLLGVGRCVSFAFNEWSENLMANLPGVLSSVGPISPLVQIGKGICDLFWMPVAEMRKEDGHVVKGIQRGAGSFGISTAAAVVDIAQRVVGVVQVAAESVLYEITPENPALNNRNRRPVGARRVTAPPDVRHGMQLAYDIIADGVQQTREDLELASQEDRASGRSSFRSVLRYTTPTILRPFVITSQISYHLLGGLKNQLRPDQFHDEQHKWRAERDGAGASSSQ